MVKTRAGAYHIFYGQIKTTRMTEGQRENWEYGGCFAFLCIMGLLMMYALIRLVMEIINLTR